MQRIQPQQFTRAAHLIAHRDLFFEKSDPQPAIARQFIERGGDAAARRIAHPANARACFSGKRFDQRQHTARIRTEVGFKIEIAARQQNGDAVVANRPGQQNLVARAERCAHRCSDWESDVRCRRS